MTIEKIKTKNSATATSTCIAENEAVSDTSLNCCTGLVKTHLSQTRTPASCNDTSTPCTGVAENYTSRKPTTQYGYSKGGTTETAADSDTTTHYSAGRTSSTASNTGVGYYSANSTIEQRLEAIRIQIANLALSVSSPTTD